MKIEVTVLSGYYEREFGHLSFWQSIVLSLWHWLKYKTKFVHRGGYYHDRKIYEIRLRRWFVRLEALSLRRRTQVMGAPAIRISPITMETKKKTHFSDCNQAVEIPLTIKNLERDNKINTPERRAWAKDMIERSKLAQRIDYEVEGHPSFDR